MKAAIDIGTNTALLLVADMKNGVLNIRHEEQRIPRLGQGVDSTGHLSDKAMNRVIEALKEYRTVLNQKFAGVEDLYVTASSAVRDAANRSDFLSQVKQQTDLEVKVLSGSEEAQYTFLGARSMLTEKLLSTQNAVIDIGGGSTELVLGNGGDILDRYSYDMGCVRFTERFLEDDPPSEYQIRICKDAIQQTLKEHTLKFGEATSLIGVAGTVTSLAYIDKKLKIYKSEQLAGHILSKEKVSSYILRFKKMSADELLQNYPEVMKGRADIFLAGLLILKQVMEAYDFKQLIVSTGGIRHGAICMHSKNT